MSRTVLANCGLKDFLWLSLCGGSPVQSYISILREVRDPRDINARHPVETILFLTLAATLCGAKSCVEVAEFTEGRESELCEIVDLPYGRQATTPSAACSAARSGRIGQAFTAFIRAAANSGSTDARRCGDRRKSLRVLRERSQPHAAADGQRMGQPDAGGYCASTRPWWQRDRRNIEVAGQSCSQSLHGDADALHCHPAMRKPCWMPRPTMLSVSRPTMGRFTPRPSAPLRRLGPTRPRLPPKRRRMAASSGAAPACWRRRSRHVRCCRVSRRWVVSKRNASERTARARQTSVMSRSRANSPRTKWPKSCVPIGASRTS